MTDAPARTLPRVVYDERLKAYMRKKGYRHIIIEHLSPCGCCADLAELVTSFADERRAAAFKGKGCVVLAGELGDVLVGRGMDYDDEVHLGLRSFFGAKDITVEGIRAWTL